MAFLTTGIALAVSCKSKSNNNVIIQTTKDSNVSTTIINEQPNDTGLTKSKEMNLNQIRHIKVLSINKENREDSSSEDYRPCKEWLLTTRQIEFVIAKFEQMTSEKQYLLYSFYKCQISGEIKIDSSRYKYWIGAGGTLTLKNGDTTLYYGCSDKKCKEYFVSGRLTKEELGQ